jgi:hypothetical protein
MLHLFVSRVQNYYLVTADLFFLLTILSLNTRYLHAYIYLFSTDYTQLLNVESKKEKRGEIFGYLDVFFSKFFHLLFSLLPLDTTRKRKEQRIRRPIRPLLLPDPRERCRFERKIVFGNATTMSKKTWVHGSVFESKKKTVSWLMTS